jgi:hypothetical protein
VETLDRYSQDCAGEIIKSLIPEKILLRRCLELLAASIERAHKIRESCWGITLFSELVRFNVGMIEVYVLSYNRLHLTIDLEIPTPDLARLDEVKVYGDAYNVYTGLYKSVQGSIRCEFPLNKLSAVLPSIQESYALLIEKAAKTRRNPGTEKGHSPGVINFLRSELGRSVSDPVYKNAI